MLHFVHMEFPDVFVYKMGTNSMLFSCWLIYFFFPTDNRMTISWLGNLDVGSIVKCLKPLTLQTMRSV